MSVYTPVTAEELEAWLTRYAVGSLVSQAPIATGIENTNYFVTTTKGRYVLTLYERLPAERAAVLPQPDGASRERRRRMSRADPRPHGHALRHAQRQAGEPRDTGRRRADATRRTSSHCAAVGAALGRLHVASATYRARLTNRRGPSWWRQAARAVRPFITPEQNELLASELKFLTGFAKVRLPRGAIHGDLFCDNVLFVGDRVSGIIDFGFAATDVLAYDLAITVNDWCIDKAGSGALVPELVAALAGAYDARAAADRGRARAMVRAACAPPRCASGCRGSTTSTCRAPASSCTRTTRRISSASCAIASMTACRLPEPPRGATASGIGSMSAPPATIDFVRYSGRRGAIWLKDAAAMLSAARIPWLMLLLFYYLIQLLVSVIPLAGPLAMMVLRPVFTVGFLAAAWTQERGGMPRDPPSLSRLRGESLGAPADRHRADRRNDARGAVDGARRRRRAARRHHVEREAGRSAGGQLARRRRDADRRSCVALPTLLAIWFAPALVVFQDCGPRQAMLTSLRAALANWRPVAVYGLLLFFCGAVLPGMAIAIISLLVPPAVAPYVIALTVVPYVFLFVAAQTISDYVAYRDIFHAGEASGPPESAD